MANLEMGDQKMNERDKETIKLGATLLPISRQLSWRCHV